MSTRARPPGPMSIRQAAQRRCRRNRRHRRDTLRQPKFTPSLFSETRVITVLARHQRACEATRIRRARLLHCPEELTRITVPGAMIEQATVQAWSAHRSLRHCYPDWPPRLWIEFSKRMTDGVLALNRANALQKNAVEEIFVIECALRAARQSIMRRWLTRQVPFGLTDDGARGIGLRLLDPSRTANLSIAWLAGLRRRVAAGCPHCLPGRSHIVPP